MKTRRLGDRQVGSIGLGCMGMSYAYGSPDNEQSIKVLHRALELGINHWDTADIYGPETNEELLSQVLPKVRDQVFLATKFGIVYERTLTSHRDLVEQKSPYFIDGTPAYVKKACEASLRRLKVDHIDLYYLHRVDKRTPIEDTVGAMAELVKEGNIRHIGLSEASPQTLRKAHAVHPITALQNEYSLWTRDHETDVIPTVRELGITLVAYSPLGRGFLTGELKSPEDLPEGDWRRNNPRFQGENFMKNLEMVDKVKEIAGSKGATPAQVALAWVLSRGEDIVPIPGTKRIKYLEQNAESVGLALSPEEVQALSALQPPAGARYNEAMLANLGG